MGLAILLSFLEVFNFKPEDVPKSFTVLIKFWTDDRLSQKAEVSSAN